MSLAAQKTELRAQAILTGRVRVTLHADDVDDQGFPTRSACRRVWTALSGSPYSAVIDLGATRHVDHELVRTIVTAIRPGSNIVIEGADSRAISAYIAEIRGA